LTTVGRDLKGTITVGRDLKETIIVGRDLKGTTTVGRDLKGTVGSLINSHHLLNHLLKSLS
jgi:hypothetical protein